MSESSVIFKSLQRFGLAGVYTTSKNSLPRPAGVMCVSMVGGSLGSLGSLLIVTINV